MCTKHRSDLTHEHGITTTFMSSSEADVKTIDVIDLTDKLELA
jgi:hypothetical protein